jgi:anti-sigma B factor antagonist
MECKHESTGGLAAFTLTGNLVGETDGMALADAFNEYLESGVTKFCIDLTELKHINSSGLGVLITLLTRTRKKDGELVLINPSTYIRNLLLITKLNSIFRIFDSKEEAVAFLIK